jgi:hypothetical protein
VQCTEINFYSFEDAIVVVFESYFSKKLNFSDFIISPILESEYDFPKDFLWLLLCLRCHLLISGRDEDHFFINLFEWLLWKFSYT